MRINMIPKEGGNRFSGPRSSAAPTASWQSDNVTDELRATGLAAGEPRRLTSPTSTSRSAGRSSRTGCGSSRRGGGSRPTSSWPTTSTRTAAPGIEDQWIQNQMVRLTWQMTPKNKLTVYHDRYPKFKGHEMGALHRS